MGGGAQSFLGRDFAEGDAEADAGSGSGQEVQDVAFCVPVLYTGVEPGDQRPQLGDGFGGVAGLAGAREGLRPYPLSSFFMVCEL